MSSYRDAENHSPNNRLPKLGSPRTPNSAAQRYLDNAGGSPLSARSPALVNSSINLDPYNRQTSSRSPSPTKFLSTQNSDLFRQSSTAHFRTLAQSSTPNKSDPSQLFIPGVSDNTEEVAGLSGRLKLQRSDTITSTAASKNWMDKQRKSLQAYEYLCHIGEAKEWIEACIGEEIAPIVELDEFLRDGVILAKVTRKFAPHIVKKIFENPRLQFRHTQNINYFFQFLDEIGMPELFTFELTDLYDKKNIPKVIYCIHALGFILAGEGLAPSVGNLVGQVDFTEEELKKTQKGLDAVGVSLPNFSGMNRHFGGEPQISEEELRNNKLKECEKEIIEFQARCRSFLFGLQHRADRYVLSSTEPTVLQLQSLCRGYLVRKSFQYDKDCLQYLAEPEVILCQAIAKGFLLRKRMQKTLQNNQVHEKQWISLQSNIRGMVIRKSIQKKNHDLLKETIPITALQAVIRGIPIRAHFNSSACVLDRSSGDIITIQNIIRGSLCRGGIKDMLSQLEAQEKSITVLQSTIRGRSARSSYNKAIDRLHDSELWIKCAQANVRGYLSRKKFAALKQSLVESNKNIVSFQSQVRGYVKRGDIANALDILDEEEYNVLLLQSMIRAAKVRQSVGTMLDTLEISEPAITRIQSAFRGLLVRYSHALIHEDLAAETESITEVQSAIKGYLVRKQFRDRMAYFKSNMQSVIKIQSFVRAKRQGDAYKSLITGSNPPLSTVKNFVHLLNDSDLDFEQEFNLEQKRKKVVDEVRKNEMLEQFIQQLDVKIALLLKNKITLDEVIRHRNKGVTGNMDTNSGRDTFNFNALNKTSRKRLELYEGMFYILQTQPSYLARLLGRLRQNVLSEKEARDIEGLLMTLFGYGHKPREEFFMLQLISRCIKEDMAVCESSSDFLRSNFVWWKLVAALNRGSRERKLLASLLGPCVRQITEDTSCDLESDPLSIYRASINSEELATGKRSTRDPNVSVEIAIQDVEARQIFIQNLQRLREFSSEILNQLHNNVDMIPYHIRFIAKEVYEQTKQKFMLKSFRSDSERQHYEDKMLSVVGNAVLQNYLNPALIAADNYGIVQFAMSPLQTKNITEITKILNQMASLKPFSRQNVFLQPLNDYIKKEIPKMRKLFQKIINIPEPEQQFGTNIYDDLTSHQRPTLYIKSSDIFAFHSLIVQEIGYLAPRKDDSLREVVQQLGALPNDASELLNIARFTEVKIDLNPGYCKMDSEEAEVNLLYVSAKRCMIYVLRVQSGANLLDILVSPVSQAHEDKYQAILREEKIERSKRSQRSMEDCHESSLGDLSKISYRELKLLTLEKVIELESYGKIFRENSYQDMLNSIAYDIRTKGDRRVSRQKEMDHIEQTLAGLAEKEHHLEQKLKTYNDYIEQAMITLQTKKGQKKKGFVMPFTKQYFHMRDLQKSGKMPKFGSYKYSAANLYDRGILVDLQGYDDRHFSQVTFTFSSDQVGIFNLEAAYGNIALPGASTDVTLDDLLSEQYNNKQYIEFFDGMVKFNTNLILHFIFKKFYGDNQ